MNQYRVNKSTATNPNNNNEVHKEGCYHYARMTSYEDLGSHSSCHSAVLLAKAKGYDADGCATCNPACHNG